VDIEHKGTKEVYASISTKSSPGRVVSSESCAHTKGPVRLRMCVKVSFAYWGNSGTADSSTLRSTVDGLRSTVYGLRSTV
jgi:hypothetical protein